MEIKLPKGYISWSQLDLWEKNPQKYIEQYIHGKPSFENKEMRFGKWFALCVQNCKSDDPMCDHLVRMVHKRKHQEAEMNVEYDGIPLKIVFDSADEKGFDEYKTGKVGWDRKRVEDHGQMDFYTLGFYLEFGFIPEQALHWLPTVDGDDGIQLTGEIHTFIVPRTMAHIERMGERIKKAVEGISNYQKHEKKIVKL